MGVDGFRLMLSIGLTSNGGPPILSGDTEADHGSEEQASWTPKASILSRNSWREARRLRSRRVVLG
jgi:hypothetical protein